MNSPPLENGCDGKGRKQEAVVIMSSGLEGRSEGMHAASASGNLRPLETKDWIGIGAADLKQQSSNSETAISWEGERKEWVGCEAV